jgi:hypothetical protein
LLLFSHPFCCDLGQLLRARFANENGNFVIGWFAAMFNDESSDGGITLRAPYTVLFKQFLRDTSNLESMISSFGIATWLDFISQTENFTCQRVSIDLRQVRAPFIQPRCLESLPATLDSAISKICRDSVRVQLRIEFTARGVPVSGDHPIGRHAILIGVIQADTGGSVTLSFCKHILNSLVMSRKQALVPSNKRLDGNRLWR